LGVYIAFGSRKSLEFGFGQETDVFVFQLQPDLVWLAVWSVGGNGNGVVGYVLGHIVFLRLFWLPVFALVTKVLAAGKDCWKSKLSAGFAQELSGMLAG